ncbi:hypothetical protein [Chitinilyticum litopenaei]|uniref:hypothetical protein n=1 Tax=Chitinilyticum litopenaei TaxID=1121276 RepID=UPI00048A7844|nr:hypothetical protein [Chitinilyticum litopenaei]
MSPVIDYGLTITRGWHDETLQEIEIQARNKHICSKTQTHVGLQTLNEFAEMLKGFPASVTDQREFEFGVPHAPGCGHIRLSFMCRDGAGHPLLQISISEASFDYPGYTESTVQCIPVSAAAIDSFIQQLEVLLPSPDQAEARVARLCMDMG